MACRIPILRFEQYCNTEATIGFIFRIVATSARFFSFLILTSSSRTWCGTQKVSRISLLYCFQLIRHLILHFSSMQRFPALNRHFRFRSVVPNPHHRTSHGKLPWENTNSQGSLIGWTTGQMFRCFSKIQLVLIQHIHFVASISFRITLRLLSPVFRLILV